jgi:hypothetical protein
VGVATNVVEDETVDVVVAGVVDDDVAGAAVVTELSVAVAVVEGSFVLVDAHAPATTNRSATIAPRTAKRRIGRFLSLNPTDRH